MEEENIQKPNFINRIRSMDLTSGNLFWKMGLFALPMALTTILQLLYTTVDLITVHIGIGETSAAAISGNSALINLIIVMFTGMASGANVAIGNAIGAKHLRHAEKVLSTSLIFAVLSGIGVGIFGYFLTPYLLRLIKIDETYFAEATTYMKIYFVGLPFLMLYNYGAQIHRAIGDSSTPFFILLISGIVNVGFDCLFVFTTTAGVAGVAWATVISEALSSVLVVISLTLSKIAPIHFNFKKITFELKSLGEIVRIGLPIGLQGFFFSLPNTFIQSALYDVGAGNIPLQNGAIAANSINNYHFAFIEALSSATMVIVAQNYGAKNKRNIYRVINYGFIWITITSIIYSIIILTAYRPLLSLFVDYNNDSAIEAGKQRLWIVGLTYFLDGYMDICSGTMKGVRHPLAPAIITAITCTLFRILWIELLILKVESMHTVLWLYSAYPFSWILALIADGIVLPRILKKSFKQMEHLYAKENEIVANSVE